MFILYKNKYLDNNLGAFCDRIEALEDFCNGKTTK